MQVSDIISEQYKVVTEGAVSNSLRWKGMSHLDVRESEHRKQLSSSSQVQLTGKKWCIRSKQLETMGRRQEVRDHSPSPSCFRLWLMLAMSCFSCIRCHARCLKMQYWKYHSVSETTMSPQNQNLQQRQSFFATFV